jgi:porphobilinogen synthase
MPFPLDRPRRLRRTEALRTLVRETVLSPDDLMWPLFVVPGEKVRNPVRSMPGVFQLSVDELVAEAQAGFEAGVRSVILFGVPVHKDAIGSGAYADDGEVARAVRALKKALPGLVVATDVCLCEYTDHGHCGILKPPKAGGPGQDLTVDNDLTLPILAKEAVAHARAGADIVAPSDMMDGRVGAIRRGLDEAGFDDLPILSYAAKFAGAFYGPFRDAAESAPVAGPGIPKDRKGYQMDPANWREAIREVELDLAEGADMVMVKPAVPRHRPAGPRSGERPGGRVPRERRVRDDQGGRPGRLDRRGAGDPRDPALHPQGRRRLHPDLHGEGRGSAPHGYTPLTEEAAIRYDVVEVAPVTEETLASVLNGHTARGWSFQSIHFVMREGSHRPAMAYLFFTGRGAGPGGSGG